MAAETGARYDPDCPHTAHAGLTAEMFGADLSHAATVLNIAAGRADLGNDLQDEGYNTGDSHTRVVSLDPWYGTPEGKAEVGSKPDFICGVAQNMPFANESFGMTVCQFGMQHMPVGNWGDAIREMVRVTKTSSNPNDKEKGYVLINPIFIKPDRVKEALAAKGLNDVSGVKVYSEDHRPIAARRSDPMMPTLWLQKTEALTPERLNEIIAVVAEMRALRPKHIRVGERISRLFHGYSEL